MGARCLASRTLRERCKHRRAQALPGSIEHAFSATVDEVCSDCHVGDLEAARASVDKAVAHGLTFMPLADTVRDTYEWWNSGVVSEERRERMVSGEGSLMAREAEIIAEWRARG